MKSKITIEVDFENGNLPVLRILQADSDDVRDKLVSQFLQSLQHTSRWAKIEYDRQVNYPIAVDDIVHRWFIRPITPKDLPSEIKLIKAVQFEFSRQMEDGFKPKLVENGVLRRSHMNTNPEKAINYAMRQVEEMPASPILTEAVLHLHDAFNLVADYEDGRR